MATSQPSLILLALMALSSFVSGSWFFQSVDNPEARRATFTSTSPIPLPVTKTPTVVPTFIETRTQIATVDPTRKEKLEAYTQLVDFCTRGQSDSDLWRSRLNALSFPTDISMKAQSKLHAPVQIVPSCNFENGNSPVAIILHYTEGPLAAAISTFQKAYNTSAHYIIDRDGQVTQVVPEQFAAYHVSCYGYRLNCLPSCPICDDADGNLVEPRTQSIGIELVNQGHINPDFFTEDIFEDFNVSFGYRYWEKYTDAQLNSLKILVADVQSRWSIPSLMVLGHSRINNNTDPGPALNFNP